MLDAFHLFFAALIIFAGSTVVSSLGFGIGMTATPLLLIFLDPQSVVVMVNTVSVALFAMIIRVNREHLPLREMALPSLAGLAGVPVGVFILSSASASVLRISITVLIILLTLVVATRVRVPGSESSVLGLLIGFTVGVLLTSLGIGGPLVVLLVLARGWSRHTVRVSLAFYFLIVEGAAVVGYGVAGLFTGERIILILVVAVPVLLGYGLASIIVRRMNERAFHRAVVVVIMLTSLMVLSREVMRL